MASGKRYRQLAREALVEHVKARGRYREAWDKWQVKYGDGFSEQMAFNADAWTQGIVGDEQMWARFAQVYALMAIMERIWEDGE